MSTATTTAVHVRWMIRRDLERVLAIENDSFEFPWREDDFVWCLKHRNNIGMVAEHGERIMGFVMYELAKTHLRILNFAVDSRFRRQGVGTVMIDKLKAKLYEQRRNRLLLEVRDSNLPGQLFFRSQGFRAVNVLRGYYPDTEDDAYAFAFRLEGR